MFDGIKITDIVSAGSAAIAAGTGLVMAWLAYKEFLKAPEQEYLEQTNGYPQEEDSSELTKITIFKTSKQATVLSIVDEQLQCEIVDTRPGRGGVQWKFPREVCKKILDENAVHANPSYKHQTGRVTIGPKKNWLYSKSLYWDPTVLENDIISLLKQLA